MVSFVPLCCVLNSEAKVQLALVQYKFDVNSSCLEMDIIGLYAAESSAEVAFVSVRDLSAFALGMHCCAMLLSDARSSHFLQLLLLRVS
jgi:hypothetical protein